MESQEVVCLKNIQLRSLSLTPSSARIKSMASFAVYEALLNAVW